MYEIEDIGIHEELLRHHGLYYRLYMVQKEMSLSDEWLKHQHFVLKIWLLALCLEWGSIAGVLIHRRENFYELIPLLVCYSNERVDLFKKVEVYFDVTTNYLFKNSHEDDLEREISYPITPEIKQQAWLENLNLSSGCYHVW